MKVVQIIYAVVLIVALYSTYELDLSTMDFFFENHDICSVLLEKCTNKLWFIEFLNIHMMPIDYCCKRVYLV